jgi:hypothetical protein
MIEHIKNKEELLAIIIHRHSGKDGVEFFTQDDFSQQLAFMKRRYS